jgi:hypothetical protein
MRHREGLYSKKVCLVGSTTYLIVLLFFFFCLSPLHAAADGPDPNIGADLNVKAADIDTMNRDLPCSPVLVSEDGVPMRRSQDTKRNW